MRGQWLHATRNWPAVPDLEPILIRDRDLEFIKVNSANCCGWRRLVNTLLSRVEFGYRTAAELIAAHKD
jgi:hypothetical protein